MLFRSCDRGTNHTDNIQFEGGTGGRIAGNWVHAATCETQGITSFDGGTNGVTIEDNVVDIPRPWGIEFYSDKNSIIRHNTVVWRADSDCEYTGQQCGQISLDHKSADPAGSGTRVYDNVATAVNSNPGSAGSADHNVSGQSVKYVGPSTSWSGFALTSPKGTASDGLDVGIRAGAGSSPTPAPSPTPPPSPTPTPSPAPAPTTDTAASALWTPPSGAKVGVTVTLDGARSKGDGPISCTWSFEDRNGSTVFETLSSCTLRKAFKYAGVKYVKLTVRDSDGDISTNKQSFNVAA